MKKTQILGKMKKLKNKIRLNEVENEPVKYVIIAVSREKITIKQR